jgi:hypothetical protein
MAPLLTIARTGRAGWVQKGSPASEDRSEAQRGLAFTREALAGGYDLGILDEVNGAVSEVWEVKHYFQKRGSREGIVGKADPDFLGRSCHLDRSMVFSPDYHQTESPPKTR